MSQCTDIILKLVPSTIPLLFGVSTREALGTSVTNILTYNPTSDEYKTSYTYLDDF